jgi:hypothetical protein
MAMHTRRGGDLEVMGLMQGKVKGGKIEELLLNALKDIYHKSLTKTVYRHLLRDGLLPTPS